MKTIKIIDLLNKITNGEKIRFKDKYREYNSCDMACFLENYIVGNWSSVEDDTQWLNEEVEIIEEEKEIEKIKIHQEYTSKGKLHDYLYYQDNKYALSLPQKVLTDTLNKLIDAVKELKGKSE